MIWPLPLTPFEDYMLADDRPNYPMNGFIRLRFAGQIHRPNLDAAVSRAISRHPLLSAVVSRPGRRWIWMPANEPPTVCWLDGPPTEALPRLKPLNVRVEPGIRVVAVQGSAQTDIIVQSHHSCCDGVGLLRFIEDLLICYALRCGGGNDAMLPPIDPQQLRHRGTFGRTGGSLRFHLERDTHALRGACRFLRRRLEPLVADEGPEDLSRLPPSYPVSYTQRLEPEETARLLDATRASGVTLNDLLVREFFLALARRMETTGHRQRQWLRVYVPMNLRCAHHDRLPAANVMSMVFLDRRLRDTQQPRRLLASIHKEMALIKRLELGATFVFFIGLFQHLPGGLSRMCRKRRCMSTAGLTNLGPLFSRNPLTNAQGLLTAGDLVLREIDFLGCWRPLTPMTFAAFSYAGRLSLTIHYNPRAFSASEATAMLDDFIGGMRGYANDAE